MRQKGQAYAVYKSPEMWRDPKSQPKATKLRPVKLPLPQQMTESFAMPTTPTVSPPKRRDPKRAPEKEQLRRWEAGSSLARKSHSGSQTESWPRKNRPFRDSPFGYEETSEEIALGKANAEKDRYLSSAVPQWVELARKNLTREHKEAK